jgi:hypothetical protein
MSYFKRLLLLVTLFAFASSVTGVKAQGDDNSDQQKLKMEDEQSSQTDVSDEELKMFASTMKDLQSLRRSQMPKMQKALKDAGLSMQEYRSLQQKMAGGRGSMKGQSEGETEEVTEEEKQKYQKAQKKVKRIQKDMQEKMSKTIEENGMTQKRFREISNAVRSDKELQKRFREMQGGGRGGGQPRGR